MNAPIDLHVFQNQRVVFYAVKMTPTRPVFIDPKPLTQYLKWVGLLLRHDLHLNFSKNRPANISSRIPLYMTWRLRVYSDY